MLTSTPSLVLRGWCAVAFYRFDCQYGVECGWLDLGFYYCCMVWYAFASDDAEYAHAREGAIRITSELLARNTVIWDLFVTNLDTGVVVEHSHPSWPHPVLSGVLGTAEMTVYISLRNAGKQVSYKRVRGPVRIADCDDNNELTDFAYDYYVSVAGLVGAYGCFTNVHGVPIETAVVDRQVRAWQLRHGTKRRNRRRLV
jgi:hypothetical protein